MNKATGGRQKTQMNSTAPTIAAFFNSIDPKPTCREPTSLDDLVGVN